MALFDAIAREAIYTTSLGRTLYRMRHVKPDSHVTITDIVEGFGRSTPDAIAILYENRTVTYRELNEQANRYARWAQAQGVKRGDVVALLMENRPEYLFAWLGIVRIGAIAALLNTNLRGSRAGAFDIRCLCASSRSGRGTCGQLCRSKCPD
jgi:fatty-acyl-CoA synthase